MKKIFSCVLTASIIIFGLSGMFFPGTNEAAALQTNKETTQPFTGSPYNDPLFEAVYIGRATQKDANASAAVEQATDSTATETQAQAEKPTETPTEKATQIPSESTEPPEATQAQTEGPTEEPTQPEAETDPPVQETPEELAYKQALYQQQWDAGYFFAIDNPDPGYSTSPVVLTEEDRYYAQRIVMGEAGTEGFTGCALVAQTLRDAMVFDGYGSIKEVMEGNGYDGWYEYPNIDAINAVTYIFDQNRAAVQHRILYFYGTYIESDWHESQNFVCQWGVSKFYDRWW